MNEPATLGQYHSYAFRYLMSLFVVLSGSSIQSPRGHLFIIYAARQSAITLWWLSVFIESWKLLVFLLTETKMLLQLG